MTPRTTRGWTRSARWLLACTATAVGPLLATSGPASAATTATFSDGTLTVTDLTPIVRDATAGS